MTGLLDTSVRLSDPDSVRGATANTVAVVKLSAGLILLLILPRRVGWQHLPGRAYGQAVILAMERREFVRLAGSGPQIVPVRKIVEEIGEALLAGERAWLAAEQARQRKVAFSMARYQNRGKPTSRRRF